MKNLKYVVALVAVFGCTAACAQSGKVVVQRLGHAAMKITTPGGKVIVIDPFLINNPMTPPEYKDLAKLGKVDIILVTHGHADHAADAPALAKLNKVPVYGPADMMQAWMTLGVLPPEQSFAPRFNKGGTVTPPGTNIKITQTHAEHSSAIIWRNPATGKDETHPGGEPVGFIIEMENGFKIYMMGDTGLFGDMKLISEYYKPDLVLIPIGGHFVMDPKDAAYATREWLKPKYAIPIHYATIPQLRGTPEEYIAALGTTSTKVFTVKPGESLEF